MTLDVGEGLLGVELGHDDHGAAHDVRVGGQAARRRVVHGSGHQVDVIGIGQVHGLERLHEALHVEGAAERALGLPRSAAGIDDGGENGLPRLDRDRRGCARGDEIVEMPRPGPPLNADEDPLTDLASLAPHGFRHREEMVAHEDGHGIGVVEDVRDLLGHEPVIHGRGNGAHGARGRARQYVLERVLRVDDDVLAGRDAEIHQPMGQAIAPLDVLGPAPHALALDERGLVGMIAGMEGQDVHRFFSASSTKRGETPEDQRASGVSLC